MSANPEVQHDASKYISWGRYTKNPTSPSHILAIVKETKNCDDTSLAEHTVCAVSDQASEFNYKGLGNTDGNDGLMNRTEGLGRESWYSLACDVADRLSKPEP